MATPPPRKQSAIGKYFNNLSDSDAQKLGDIIRETSAALRQEWDQLRLIDAAGRVDLFLKITTPFENRIIEQGLLDKNAAWRLMSDIEDSIKADKAQESKQSRG